MRDYSQILISLENKVVRIYSTNLAVILKRHSLRVEDWFSMEEFGPGFFQSSHSTYI